MDTDTSFSNILKALAIRAEAKFGKDRAVRLQPEIELMTDDLYKLYERSVEFEDEA
jgi:hypothetical protein